MGNICDQTVKISGEGGRRGALFLDRRGLWRYNELQYGRQTKRPDGARRREWMKVRKSAAPFYAVAVIWLAYALLFPL